jgi:hypothetical protein
MSTFEGADAWREASEFLTYNQPEQEYLKWSEGLSQACYDHIRDQGPQGGNGHIGSNGSGPSDRIYKYVTTSMTGENIAYSDYNNGEEVILQLIIDDGVPSRGHRNNIFESGFTHMGVSCGCHTLYKEMCCIAYGKDLKEKDPNMQAFNAPQLSTCKKYDPITRGDISNSFHVDPNVPVQGKQEPKPVHTQVKEDKKSRDPKPQNSKRDNKKGRTEDKKPRGGRSQNNGKESSKDKKVTYEYEYNDYIYPDE